MSAEAVAVSATSDAPQLKGRTIVHFSMGEVGAPFLHGRAPRRRGERGELPTLTLCRFQLLMSLKRRNSASDVGRILALNMRGSCGKIDSARSKCRLW